MQRDSVAQDLHSWLPVACIGVKPFNLRGWEDGCLQPTHSGSVSATSRPVFSYTWRLQLKMYVIQY